MPRLQNLKNRQFGILTVLQKGKSDKNKRTTWLCKCQCGIEKEIANRHLISGSTKSCGCLRRRRGIGHPHWKSGRWADKHGYILIKDRTHPNTNNCGYVREHIRVMSSFLGRPLFKDEMVHHKNGDKGDNRIDNLELILHHAHHSGQSIKDLIPYWKEMLARYDK